MNLNRNGYHGQQQRYDNSPHNQRRPEGFRRLPLSQFVAQKFAQEYLIDGMLVRGGCGLIAGAKKTLKTSVMLDMAVSLATGTAFLGTFDVPRSVQVGVMTRESGEATIQDTLLRICRAKGIPPDGKLSVSSDLPNLGDTLDLSDLERFIEEDGLEVLCLDPAYLAIPLEGNEASSLFAVGRYLRPLTEMGQRTGCTILLVHHNRKSRGFEPPQLDDIAWAGFQEWARQWLLLGRRKKFDPESNGLHELWLSVGGSAGHHSEYALDIEEGRISTGRYWRATVTKASRARAAAAQDASQAKEARSEASKRRTVDGHKQRILDALAGSSEPMTAREIRDRCSPGINSASATSALGELVAEERIATCNVGRKNGTQVAYKIIE